MFYANKAQYIRNNSTVISPTQIFVGDYWDEFALTQFFVPGKANLLVLGLALGGCIRPILSSKKQVQLTCVDMNESTNRKCARYFQTHFPDLKFKIKTQMAESCLEQLNSKQDAIWIDIYHHDSYTQTLFRLEFWQQVKNSIKARGVVLVNSFGLPMQFSPLTESPIQKRLIAELQGHFSFVGYVPHRRNLTLVACDQVPEFYESQPHNDLSSIDQFSLQIMRKKAQHLAVCLRVENKMNANLTEDMRFSEIDALMISKWDLILERLRSYGIAIENRKDLIPFIQNEAQARRYLEQQKGHFDIFVPILAAGQSRLMELELDWLFDWFSENSEKIRAENGEQFYQIWLPQMWNILIGSERRYLKHIFKFKALLRHDGGC